MNIRKKSQSTAEYAILIGIIIAVAIGMQTYVKRSMQGGIKYAVDKVQKSGTAQAQYEPYYLQSSYTTNTSVYKDTEQTKEGGEVIRTFGADNTPKTVTRSGEQVVRDTSGAD